MGGRWGGVNPRELDENLLFGNFFAEDCMKTKEIGPTEGVSLSPASFPIGLESVVSSEVGRTIAKHESGDMTWTSGAGDERGGGGEGGCRVSGDVSQRP